jgi:hypothetical protein
MHHYDRPPCMPTTPRTSSSPRRRRGGSITHHRHNYHRSRSPIIDPPIGPSPSPHHSPFTVITHHHAHRRCDTTDGARTHSTKMCWVVRRGKRIARALCIPVRKAPRRGKVKRLARQRTLYRQIRDEKVVGPHKIRL